MKAILPIALLLLAACGAGPVEPCTQDNGGQRLPDAEDTSIICTCRVQYGIEGQLTWGWSCDPQCQPGGVCSQTCRKECFNE